MSTPNSWWVAPTLAVAAWAAADVAWGQASAPAIPFRPGFAGDTPEPQQWLLAVLGSALLLIALIYIIRRFGTRLPRFAATERQILVIERTALAHGVQLVVVEYGERRLLLSVSAAGTTCLRDDPVTVAPSNQLQPGGATT